ncbi:hypothetical protein niasHT_009858 [Heterodera trifolii]|uniref:Uncharacterized protein n=1 Tax=Heterodera trifolii TaxID=157864 RepID=A0ABD2LRF2_9BILA
MLQQNRGHCRLVKRLFFGRRPFVRLALTLFCLLLLIVLALLVEFPSKWTLTFNGLGPDGKFSSYANSDGIVLGDDGNGVAVPSKCCQCADGWRGHFVPAETEARVFQSVRREHIELLAKLNEAQAKMDAIEAKMGEKEAELSKLVLRVEELKLLQREYSDSRAVRVQLPHSPPKGGERFEEDGEAAEWDGEGQFDFSRCSIAIPSMPLFVFPPLSSSSINGTANSAVPSALAAQFHRQFVSGQQIASITATPANACLFVSIIDTADDGRQMAGADENGTKTTAKGEKHRIESTLFRQQLAISGGKNHLVFDLHGHLGAVDRSLLGAAVLVTPRPAAHAAMRRSEQRLLPLHLNVPAPSVDRWRELPPLLPVMRKYFVRLVANPALLSRRQIDDLARLKTSMSDHSIFIILIVFIISLPFWDSSRDSHLIDLECPSSFSASSVDHLCYAAADDRLRMGRQSVFTVLLFPEMPSFQRKRQIPIPHLI